MAITLSQLATRLAKAADKVPAVTNKELEKMAQVGSGYMKSSIQELHAVDTGTMLNSTTVEKSGDKEYSIGPTVDYAIFVALGTSRMEGRPFHTIAANKLNKDASAFGLKPENLGL